MKTPLALAPLLALLVLPIVSAEHGPTCGAADGHLGSAVYAWLEPGCVGASVRGNCPIDQPLAHGLFLGLLVYADYCSAGVWIP